MPVTPAEICAAHPKSAGKDLDVSVLSFCCFAKYLMNDMCVYVVRQAFRFRIAVARQMPAGQTLTSVAELDLSHSALKLKSVDLTQLKSVRKLSLAYNSLQSKHLSKCHITALVTLTDVRIIIFFVNPALLLISKIIVGLVTQSNIVDQTVGSVARTFAEAGKFCIGRQSLLSVAAARRRSIGTIVDGIASFVASQVDSAHHQWSSGMRCDIIVSMY
jgi:hypothetical protein